MTNYRKIENELVFETPKVALSELISVVEKEFPNVRDEKIVLSYFGGDWDLEEGRVCVNNRQHCLTVRNNECADHISICVAGPTLEDIKKAAYQLPTSDLSNIIVYYHHGNTQLLVLKKKK